VVDGFDRPRYALKCPPGGKVLCGLSGSAYSRHPSLHSEPRGFLPIGRCSVDCMAHWANLLPLPRVGSPPLAQPEAPLAQATFAIRAATLLMPKSGRERAAPPTTCRPNGLTC